MPKGGFSIELLGDKRLARKFATMAPNIQKIVLAPAMRAAWKPLLEKVKGKIPKDSGDLRKGMKLRALKRSRKGIGFHIITPPREKLRNSGKKGYYPAHIELGNEKQSPNPFMRGPFKAHEPEANQIIRAEIKRRILHFRAGGREGLKGLK